MWSVYLFLVLVAVYLLWLINKLDPMHMMRFRRWRRAAWRGFDQLMGG